jgi:glutathione S-transferase
VYPTDLQARAKVNEYLNWHHSNARFGTTRVLRPLVLKKMDKASPEMLELAKPESIATTLGKPVGILEKFLVKPYIAHSAQPTIADYACYCELDQIEAMGVFDFTKYPKTSDWLKRMKVGWCWTVAMREGWALF